MVASILDGLILAVFNAILAVALVATVVGSGGDPEGLEAVALSWLPGLLVSWLYYALMHSSPSQATWGKRALDIKVVSLTGERIGFVAISPSCHGWPRIFEACAFTNRTLGYVNAPALMQRVVAEVQSEVVDLDWYRRKRDRFCGELGRIGYNVPRPGGAFYIFPEAPGGDDIAFMQAMKERRVLVAPGVGFGWPGHFRIAYCVHDDNIEGSLPAFEDAFRALSRH